MKLLVTGGAGFIGSNYVHWVLANRPDVKVVNFDKLTDVANEENLRDIEQDPRYRFVKGDVADPDAVDGVMGGCDAVVHFAAESHVDRSILDASSFYRTNVEGTLVMLEAARVHKPARFVQISTDEVYGSLGETGSFSETSPIQPNSPYAASKAAADLFVRSYVETHGVPAVVTRCCNNYGPYQFPEKLIPLVTIRALEEKTLPVYGDGSNVRDWIYVDDHCAAIHAVLESGKVGEVYNIGSRAERPNLAIVREILKRLSRSEDLIRFVKDRPGHDWRYAIDPTKIESELGWKPAVSFESGVDRTVSWYRENADWWEAIRRRPSWAQFFASWYDDRLANARREKDTSSND